jgi:ferredoxin-thioredoxin reductase catalytic chain
MNSEQLLEVSRKYADKQGFQLQSDKEILGELIKGLLENEKKFGFRFCPCRAITGDKAKDAKIICPCVYHKEEIRTMGHCHCGLYLAKPK